MGTQTPIILLILLILSKHIPSPPVLGQIKSTCPKLRLFKSAFSGISFNLLFLLFFVAKNSLELWGRAPPKSLPFGNQQPVRRSAAPAGHVFSPCRVDFAAQHLQPPCTSITAQCDMRFCNYLTFFLSCYVYKTVPHMVLISRTITPPPFGRVPLAAKAGMWYHTRQLTNVRLLTGRLSTERKVS